MTANNPQTENRGLLRDNEPMAKHTSWRVGGSAEHYYEPADLDDLANYLSQISNKEPVMMIGLGSNLLVRDKGIKGHVICSTGLLNGFEVRQGNMLRVEVGVPCAIVAKRCAKLGFSGLEFLAGIPGTIGGALAMNAGAFGGETWRDIERVETIDQQGRFHLRDREEYLIGYRSVIGPMDEVATTQSREWFVAAHFKLKLADENNDTVAGLEKIKQLLALRAETQPTGVPSCGSVFRNPEGDYAARLIEACGLKGLRVGNAQVSEKHANFIINVGDAKAKDIEDLILVIMEKVKQKYDVELESEVRIVGDE